LIGFLAKCNGVEFFLANCTGKERWKKEGANERRKGNWKKKGGRKSTRGVACLITMSEMQPMRTERMNGPKSRKMLQRTSVVQGKRGKKREQTTKKQT